MSVPGSDPLDAATAERLLDGDSGGPPRLVELLTLAAAPGREDELVGEDAAVAAFRATRETPAVPRPRQRRSALARLIPARFASARAAALSLAFALALAAGGVALAAGIGVIPSPLPGTRVPAPSSPSPAATGWTRPSTVDNARTTPPPAPPPRSAALEGLCRAYAAHLKSKPDKASANPMFDVLAEAAGGADKVPEFCAALLPSSAPGKPPSSKEKKHTSDPPAGPKPAPRGDAKGSPKPPKTPPVGPAPESNGT